MYRKNFGFTLWNAGYDGAMDYAYQAEVNDVGHIWNDFDNPEYRDLVFAYPATSGVIDTIQWEGFREGVDDSRYIATAIKHGVSSSAAKTTITNSLALGDNMATLRNKVINLIPGSLTPTPTPSPTPTPTPTSLPTANKPSEMGIFNNGSWNLDNNGDDVFSGTDKTVHFGTTGDLPVTGDWNNDSSSDIGVFRPSNGNWYLDYNNNGVTDKSFHFGTKGDIPVVADWNGDGTTDVGVFRPSNGNWYLDTTMTSVVNKTFHFGTTGDIPLAGDWNGDGTMDVAVFRPSNGNWYLDTTMTSVVNKTFHFGTTGDIPVTGDWDGNGVLDVGVFRNFSGSWYLDATMTGVVNKTFHFGSQGWTPVIGKWS
jgi:hypothetical protein